MNFPTRFAACLGLIAALPGPSRLSATPVFHDEAVHGDLSSLAPTPTLLDFDVGVNRITGSMGRPAGNPLDRDFFTFTLEPGELLTSINVVALTLTGNFYAIQIGPTIDTTDAGPHLSNALVQGTGELLDDLQFTPFSGPANELMAPLGAGTYTVWYQETSAPVNYTFDYTVAAIPEPATYAALAGALALGLTISRRRRA